MTDQDRPEPTQVPQRLAQLLARLLHPQGLRDDGTIDVALTGQWLPDAGHGLDALWEGLAPLRAELEQARADWQSAEGALRAARGRLETLDGMRANAARASLDVELPSRRGAEEAVDDALTRLDAARQRFAETAVAAFARARELEGSWRAATGEARLPLEDREAELLAELEQVRARLRAIGTVGPWLDAVRDVRWVQPFGALVQHAEDVAGGAGLLRNQTPDPMWRDSEPNIAAAVAQLPEEEPPGGGVVFERWDHALAREAAEAGR